jgi:hypothetical protein
LTVCGVNDVRETETHTADLLVSEPSASDVEMTTKKIRRHKSPGTAEIPAELIKAGNGTIRSEVPNTEGHDQVRGTPASYSEGPRLQISASITPTLRLHLHVHPRSDLV